MTFGKGSSSQEGKREYVEYISNTNSDIDPSWVIESSEISFISKLGSGTFAKVYKGLYHNEEVAVKILKHPDKSKDEFLKEFKLMRYIIYYLLIQLKHCQISSCCISLWSCSSSNNLYCNAII